MRHADGNWVWLRARCELVRQADEPGAHLIGIAVDITEQKTPGRADDARPICGCATRSRRSRKPSWCGTPTTGWCCATRISRSLHSLPDEAVAAGTPYEAVSAAGSKPIVRTQLANEDGQRPGARTFEAQLDDGRWLQISERRTKDGGYVSVGTDITELKLHEEKLIESEKRLMATDRRPALLAAGAGTPDRANSPISRRNTPRKRPAPRRPTRPSRSSSPT